MTTLKELLNEFDCMDIQQYFNLRFNIPNTAVRVNDNYYKSYCPIFNRYVIDIVNKYEEVVGEMVLFKTMPLNVYRELYLTDDYELAYCDLLYNSSVYISEFAAIYKTISEILLNDQSINNLIILYTIKLNKEFRGKQLLAHIMDAVYNTIVTSKTLFVLQAIPLEKYEDVSKEEATKKLINYYKNVFIGARQVEISNFITYIR